MARFTAGKTFIREIEWTEPGVGFNLKPSKEHEANYPSIIGNLGDLDGLLRAREVRFPVSDEAVAAFRKNYANRPEVLA